MATHRGTLRALPTLVTLLGLGLGLAACDPGGDGPEDGTPGQVMQSQRLLRRLTRFEYDNTVRDLLGMPSTWGQGLPADDVVNGFDNNARALQVGPLLLDKLQLAAEEIAEAAGKDLARLVPCEPAKGDEACARRFVGSFGARAFRRPLTEAEKGRYLDLYRANAVDGFAEGVKVVIAALLQSPHFLYRAELGRPSGAAYALTPYEVASELSYLLWGSMPDEALFAAAAAGELGTAEQLRAQALRLIKSDRARPQIDHFADQWLQLDRLDIASKDSKVYPELTAELRTAMRLETTALFDQVMRKGGALGELFRADYTYVPDGLARFYGLTVSTAPADAAGLRRTDLGGSGRGGLLTHGSLLTIQATSHSSSPVHRGKLVRVRLLCQDLPPPPAGLVVQLPAVDPALSTRERFSEHSKNPVCSGCHQMMDPIGFGFERFDGIGRLRMSEAGKAINDAGEIVGAGALSGSFQGVAALQARLAGSAEVADCFSLQWFRYAYGIAEDDTTRALATQAATGFREGGQTFEALALALVGLPRFLYRDGDGSGAPGEPGQPDPPPPPPVDMAPPPPPPTGFTAAVKRDSEWETGYCSTVVVTNTGAQAGDWAVTLEIQGTINNLWNASQAPAAKGITFSGLSYNKNLAPGATASFGFCANK